MLTCVGEEGRGGAEAWAAEERAARVSRGLGQDGAAAAMWASASARAGAAEGLPWAGTGLRREGFPVPRGGASVAAGGGGRSVRCGGHVRWRRIWI